MSEDAQGFSGSILLRAKRGKLPEIAHIFEAMPEGVALTTYEGGSEIGKEYLLPRDVARSYYAWLRRHGFRQVSKWRGFGKQPEKAAEKPVEKSAEVVDIGMPAKVVAGKGAK